MVKYNLLGFPCTAHRHLFDPFRSIEASRSCGVTILAAVGGSLSASFVSTKISLDGDEGTLTFCSPLQVV